MGIVEQVKVMITNGEIDIETRYHVERLLTRYEQIIKVMESTARTDIAELEYIRRIIKE